MLFGTMDHGAILSIFGVKTKAIQYVLGNPLIAIQMTQHNLAVGLYAPLRVLVFLARKLAPNSNRLLC